MSACLKGQMKRRKETFFEFSYAAPIIDVNWTNLSFYSFWFVLLMEFVWKPLLTRCFDDDRGWMG